MAYMKIEGAMAVAPGNTIEAKADINGITIEEARSLFDKVCALVCEALECQRKALIVETKPK